MVNRRLVNFRIVSAGAGRTTGRNHCGDAAPIRKLSMQERIVFIQFLAEVIRDHFEPGSQFARVESNASFRADDPVTLVPPGRVGIAHDLAHALVEQKRLDRTKEWKDQIESS